MLMSMMSGVSVARREYYETVAEPVTLTATTVFDTFWFTNRGTVPEKCAAERSHFSHGTTPIDTDSTYADAFLQSGVKLLKADP